MAEYTKAERQKFIRALNMIRGRAIRGEKQPEPKYGICVNLKAEVCPTASSGWYMLVAELAVGWPEHSGRPVYPVPYPGVYIDPWRGEQLRMRVSLLGYMVARLAEGLRPWEVPGTVRAVSSYRSFRRYKAAGCEFYGCRAEALVAATYPSSMRCQLQRGLARRRAQYGLALFAVTP